MYTVHVHVPENYTCSNMARCIHVLVGSEKDREKDSHCAASLSINVTDDYYREKGKAKIYIRSTPQAVSHFQLTALWCCCGGTQTHDTPAF